jgi:hypothetical protein
MDCVPETSPQMKTMPPEIFQEKCGGLQEILATKWKQSLPAAA